jgi:hypothetical protein
MYTPDDIDFGALSNETLQALALEIDPFIATSALSELSRDPAVERATARALLRQTPDPWLRSSAFSITLDDDPDEALGWLAEHLPDLEDASLDKLLGTLASDDAWRSSPRAAAVQEAVRRRLDAPGGELDRDAAARVIQP